MATTWSPTDNQQLTLSNGNLTATATTGGYSAVRTNISWSSGKVYFEVTVSASTSPTASELIGIANATWGLYTQLGAGSPSNSVGVDLGYPGLTPAAPQVVYLNNAYASTAGTHAIPVGNVIGIAVDYTAKLFWYTSDQMQTDLGAGVWNNNFTSDPGSGLNGVDFSSQTGPFFGAWNTDTTGNAVTLNAIGPFHFGLPSGFSSADPSRQSNISATQAPQTLVANGAVGIKGQISTAQSAQPLTAAGTTSFPGRSGAIAATQDAETLIASGSVTSGLINYGPIIATQAPQTLSAAGTVTTVAQLGVISATQAPQTLLGSGFVGAMFTPTVIWMD